MKHTDLITDKDAAYAESTGDWHHCANALTLIFCNLRAKYKCKLINFDMLKNMFLNSLSSSTNCGCK